MIVLLRIISNIVILFAFYKLIKNNKFKNICIFYFIFLMFQIPIYLFDAQLALANVIKTLLMLVGNMVIYKLKNTVENKLDS